MAFLFVLDTPKCKCAKAQGSRQTVSSELTPREFHPNWRSARAALIACGGLDTARTVTGREYHYALCGLWRNRGLPDIWSQYRFAHPRYLLVGRSWRTAPHAYAHHNHKEEVFGEWLFGCQGTILFTPHKGKQGGGFRPLTLSPMGNYEFPLIIKIFFWFFLSACPYACKPPFVKYQRECSLKLF